MGKCGCGRDGRRITPGSEEYSCNKYGRCKEEQFMGIRKYENPEAYKLAKLISAITDYAELPEIDGTKIELSHKASISHFGSIEFFLKYRPKIGQSAGSSISFLIDDLEECVASVDLIASRYYQGVVEFCQFILASRKIDERCGLHSADSRKPSSE